MCDQSVREMSADNLLSDYVLQTLSPEQKLNADTDDMVLL